MKKMKHKSHTVSIDRNLYDDLLASDTRVRERFEKETVQLKKEMDRLSHDNAFLNQTRRSLEWSLNMVLRELREMQVRAGIFSYKFNRGKWEDVSGDHVALAE